MYYNGKHDSTQMSLTFEKNTPEETEFCLKHSPNKNEPQSTMDLLNFPLTNEFFKEKSSFLCCEDIHFTRIETMKVYWLSTYSR